jgi:hypothetical protein
MRHLATGIIALLLLVGSGLLFLLRPEWDESLAFASSSLRIGLVLGAIWLAYPELIRLPKWLIPLLIGAAVTVAFRPKSALFLVPIVLVVLILRPKRKAPPPAKAARR